VCERESEKHDQCRKIERKTDQKTGEARRERQRAREGWGGVTGLGGDDTHLHTHTHT